jgi:hypothetical protein
MSQMIAMLGLVLFLQVLEGALQEGVFLNHASSYKKK